MARDETIISFDDVTFEHEMYKPILSGANFSVRRGTKITIMGQNGAGKSTILKLIKGDIWPESGMINVFPGTSIATAFQVMPHEDRELTVQEFFEKHLGQVGKDIDKKMIEVL
jgi:ATPase subunit of ABC transporter with duplicated ATPase domains